MAIYDRWADQVGSNGSKARIARNPTGLVPDRQGSALAASLDMTGGSKDGLPAAVLQGNALSDAVRGHAQIRFRNNETAAPQSGRRGASYRACSKCGDISPSEADGTRLASGSGFSTI